MNTRDQQQVFVLGGTGFIGSELVEQLVAAGQEVSCLVHRTNLPAYWEQVKAYRGALTNFDWRQLEQKLPAVIYHFARMPGKGRRGRLKAARKNARANERLLDWMRSLDHPPLLVFGSGTLVYGSRDEMIDEEVSLAPVSYQREYVEAEIPVLQAMQKEKLPIMVIRPPWIYGTGSWFRWLYWQLIQEDGIVPQFAKGHNFLSLIHRADCVGLIRHIACSGEIGHVYNVYHHEPMRQKDFASLLSACTGYPVRKLPYWRLWWSYDKATRKALTFSLKVGSKHDELYRKYESKYPNLEEGLRQVVRSLEKEEH